MSSQHGQPMGMMLQGQPGQGVTPGRQDQVTMLIAQGLDSIQQALSQLDPADERAVILSQCEQQLGIALANPYQLHGGTPQHEGGSEEDMARTGNQDVSGLPDMR
jgi:hypothetical protein